MLLQQEETTDAVARGVSLPAGPSRPVDQIVRDLGSRDKEVRGAAQTELAALGPDAAEPLLHALETEGAKYRKQRRVYRIAGYTIAGSVLTHVTLGMVQGLTTGSRDLLSNFASFSGLFGLLGAAAAMSPRHKSVVSLMANLDDVRSIGWLADALLSDDKLVRANAGWALVRLLPRLTIVDAALLDADSRRSLDRALQKSNNSDLVLAILGAYAVLGHSDSLDAVIAVELERAVVKLPAVVDRAHETADAIRAREEREREAHLLLRAVESGDDSGMLLRPSGGEGGRDPALLLRPAGSESTK
jgi:hypothetical protein